MQIEEFPFHEIIAEAARGRFRVRMSYNAEMRTIEPYSYRQGNVGALFYGFHVEAGKIKAFDLSKIESVEMTEEEFSPQWTVEIA